MTSFKFSFFMAVAGLAASSAFAQNEEFYKNAAGYTLTLSNMKFKDGTLTSADARLAKGNTMYLKGPVTFDKMVLGSALLNDTCQYSFKPGEDKFGNDSGWVVNFRDRSPKKTGCKGLPPAVAGTYK